MLTALRLIWLRLFGDPPDDAWRAQTPVQRFTGYDQDQARQGVARARQRALRVVGAPMPGRNDGG